MKPEARKELLVNLRNLGALGVFFVVVLNTNGPSSGFLISILAVIGWVRLYNILYMEEK